MKKRLIISILMVLLLGTIALAQNIPSNWRWNKTINTTSTPVHGVVITPDDYIWYQTFGNEGTVGNSNIVICDPDGNQVDRFSVVTINGVEYDMKARGAGGRGMSAGGPDKQYVYHSTGFDVYVFDYQTKQAVLRIEGSGAGTSATTACADLYGNIVTTGVIGPVTVGIRMFGDDGTYLGYAIPPGDLPGISRDLTMTHDGKYISIAASNLAESGLGIGLWYCEDGTFGDGYTFVREIGDYKKGTAGNAQEVHFDQYDRLWVGRDWNGLDPLVDPDYGIAVMHCWDITQDPPVIVDAIYSTVAGETEAVALDAWAQGAFNMPRGFWLSNDGTKAYVGDYNRGVQEYVYTGPGQSDAKEPQAVPEGFALSQNYPNPFNPSTKFTYTMPNKADVRIAIYDLFGREINTLVNESKDAGTYNITWNGRDNQNRQVATGVYFYKMQAAGFEKTMKMMLVK